MRMLLSFALTLSLLSVATAQERVARRDIAIGGAQQRPAGVRLSGTRLQKGEAYLRRRLNARVTARPFASGQTLDCRQRFGITDLLERLENGEDQVGIFA